MMEKLAQAGEGGGALYLPSSTKLWCTIPGLLKRLQIRALELTLSKFKAATP